MPIPISLKHYFLQSSSTSSIQCNSFTHWIFLFSIHYLLPRKFCFHRRWFVCLSDCLFVCLFVCVQDNTKSTAWIGGTNSYWNVFCVSDPIALRRRGSECFLVDKHIAEKCIINVILLCLSKNIHDVIMFLLLCYANTDKEWNK